MKVRRAILSHALHGGVLMSAASPSDVIKTNTPGLSVDGGLMRQRLVDGLIEDRWVSAGLAVSAVLLAIRHPRRFWRIRSAQ